MTSQAVGGDFLSAVLSGLFAGSPFVLMALAAFAVLFVFWRY